MGGRGGGQKSPKNHPHGLRIPLMQKWIFTYFWDSKKCVFVLLKLSKHAFCALQKFFFSEFLLTVNCCHNISIIAGIIAAAGIRRGFFEKKPLPNFLEFVDIYIQLEIKYIWGIGQMIFFNVFVDLCLAGKFGSFRILKINCPFCFDTRSINPFGPISWQYWTTKIGKERKYLIGLT